MSGVADEDGVVTRHGGTPDPLIGQRLGNFAITEELGRGGMGVVYLAEHVFIARKKAVKILHPDKATDPSLVRRFENEAMAACAIEHDHIVTIEDCGTFFEGGQEYHYIVMEYLEGESLGRLLRPPLSTDRRLADLDRLTRIAAVAADALAAAHARGIVHRDVTPENIFLARRGGRTDFVKVLDFGIARLTGDLSPGARTHTGVVLGTPSYMSPEQARGLHPDGRSDVFSLGAVLYRAITGDVPFHGSTDTELSLQICNIEPTPMAVFRKGIPPVLERAVTLAMAKRPEDRPTMRELGGLLADSESTPQRIGVDVTTEHAVARAAPPAITIDPAQVRTAPHVPHARSRRDD